MGPRSRDILQPLTDQDLNNEAFPWLSARQISVAGASALALRVSYAGELGWELHAAPDDLPTIYKALVESGTSHDLKHFGAFALNSMRLEKGYRAWGMDLSTERTPLEAGLAYLVKTDGREFLGRDALV